MCLQSWSFTLIVYFIAINLFSLFLRYVTFYDYFHCFVCKELDSCKQDYDYIVVGSGSAGSIVAQRLSEDKDIKVLLIEAGCGGHGLLDIPALTPLFQNSLLDWQYRTVPQKKACLGFNKQVSYWPMGKITGGTSTINNMIYVRGHQADFAKWYENEPGYNYNRCILPYFQKLENSSVILEDLPFLSNLSQTVIRAAKCANYPISDGVNVEQGFSHPKVTMSKGHRWTPWHHLSNIKKRRNLVIYKNSFVEKIIFKEDYEASGVVYSHLDDQFEVFASKGIILSAGVIGSPKILMLSGIGPTKHLKNVKIKPILDLPVGNNLQDHVTTGYDLILVDEEINVGIDTLMSPFSAFKYFINSNGPWTSVGCENLAFFSTDSDKEKPPDLQFMVLPIGVTIDDGVFLKSLVGIKDKVWDQYFAKICQRAFTILPIVLHPKSRGTVRLKNNNPKTPPLIDPNYLSNSYDVEMLLWGIEEIKKFLKSIPMQNIGARLNNQTFPGCEKYEFDTNPYWECYVRHLTISSFHPVGTCKLGEVVDYDFQVKGTNKLYVVDGSILPELPSGNPNGAIMMMAEKASDVIKYHRFLTEQKCQDDKKHMLETFFVE